MSIGSSRTLDLGLGADKFLPIEPLWFLENQISVPVGIHRNDLAELITAIVFIFRAVFDLNAVFGVKGNVKGRGIEEDQLQIFGQLEKALSTSGFDGEQCLLRFICEAQQKPLKKLNLLGEMLTVLLTPKKAKHAFLTEYLKAEERGREGICTGYSRCSISLFNIYDFLIGSTPTETPKETLSEGEVVDSSKSS